MAVSVAPVAGMHIPNSRLCQRTGHIWEDRAHFSVRSAARFLNILRALHLSQCPPAD